MSNELKRFDASDYLTDEESIAEYLNAAMEEGDQALLMAAIADVARATVSCISHLFPIQGRFACARADLGTFIALWLKL